MQLAPVVVISAYHSSQRFSNLLVCLSNKFWRFDNVFCALCWLDLVMSVPSEGPATDVISYAQLNSMRSCAHTELCLLHV
jgi:hypothetical protein